MRQELLRKFQGNNFKVTALAVDAFEETFFAGENYYEKGRVVRFNLESGRKLCDFDSLNVGGIVASYVVGKFAIFAGKTLFRFWNMEEKQFLMKRPVAINLQYLQEMELCKVGKFYWLLAVVGYSPDYSNSRTDLINVSNLFPPEIEAKEKPKRKKRRSEKGKGPKQKEGELSEEKAQGRGKSGKGKGAKEREKAGGKDRSAKKETVDPALFEELFDLNTKLNQKNLFLQNENQNVTNNLNGRKD